MQISLNELTNNGEVRNLSGHERGSAARNKFHIGELDTNEELVVIEVPAYIYTITPSFFQGMFAESVRRLGSRERFLEKYSFNADPVVLDQIEKGIRISLMQRGSLFPN
nr:hypothetical protein [Brucella anthropi]